MKKLFAVIMILAFAFLATGVACALDLQAGADVSAMLKKKIEIKNLGSDKIDADMTAQYYDLCDIIKIGDIFTVIPMIGINSGSLKSEFGTNDFEANAGVGWNLGVQAQADVYKSTAESKKIVDLALIGSYRFTRNDIDEFVFNGNTMKNDMDSQITLHQYEIGAIVSKSLKDITNLPVTPYVGVVYSDLIGSASIANQETVDLNAKDNFGVRLGVKTEPLANVAINVDIKLIDETAIGAKATIKF
jgi:hypothetical protein